MTFEISFKFALNKPQTLSLLQVPFTLVAPVPRTCFDSLIAPPSPLTP